MEISGLNLVYASAHILLKKLYIDNRVVCGGVRLARIFLIFLFFEFFFYFLFLKNICRSGS